MMTRKDYVSTAEVLKSTRQFVHPAIFTKLIKDFGKVFADDNPRFDFERFENACRDK